MKIYEGEEAYKVCNMILANGGYSTPIEGYDVFSAGFWREGDKWMAYDNTTGDCWVEEFKTRKEAKDWVLDRYELMNEI